MRQTRPTRQVSSLTSLFGLVVFGGDQVLEVRTAIRGSLRVPTGRVRQFIALEARLEDRALDQVLEVRTAIRGSLRVPTVRVRQFIALEARLEDRARGTVPKIPRHNFEHVWMHVTSSAWNDVYFLYITVAAVQVDAQKDRFTVVIARVQVVLRVLGNCVSVYAYYHRIVILARRSMLLSNAMCSYAVADQGARTDICTGATVKTAAQAQAQAQGTLIFVRMLTRSAYAHQCSHPHTLLVFLRLDMNRLCICLHKKFSLSHLNLHFPQLFPKLEVTTRGCPVRPGKTDLNLKSFGKCHFKRDRLYHDL